MTQASWSKLKVINLRRNGLYTENNPIGLLLRILPSIVHHSDFLYDVIRNVPGHPFSMIPLLQNPALLARLKEHVTTRPSVAMKIATGIPPHIHLAVMVKKVLECCTETLEEVKLLAEKD